MQAEKFVVTLANKNQVDWEEFMHWSQHKQRMSLMPHTHKVTWGEEHCRKMREIVTASYADGTRRVNWNYGEKNGRSRAVITPQGQFPSITAAAQHYAVTGNTMKDWITKTRADRFRFVNEMTKDEISKRSCLPKPVMTPDGRFPSIKAAAEHYQVGIRTIKTWIRGMRADEFNYI